MPTEQLAIIIGISIFLWFGIFSILKPFRIFLFYYREMKNAQTNITESIHFKNST